MIQATPELHLVKTTVVAVATAVVVGVKVNFFQYASICRIATLVAVITGASISNGISLAFLKTEFSFSAKPASSPQSPVLKFPSASNSTLTSVDQALGDISLKSIEGRPIEFIQVQIDKMGPKTRSNADKAMSVPRFLVQGGIHGNESLTPKFILWLATRVARGESSLNLLPLDAFDIDFLPSANPDGAAKNTRLNKAGVNLNRNFGVLWGISRENPGTSSFSEPETKSIKALFEKQKYLAAVDVHGYVNWMVAPSQPQFVANEAPVTEAQISRYKTWIKSLSRVTKFLGNYQLKTAGGLGDGGSFEDWAFWKSDTFSFCLELASNERYTDDSLNPNDNSSGVFTPTSALQRFSKRALQRSDSNDSFLTYEHAVYMAFSEAISASVRPRDDKIANRN